ncbi:glutathione S-transferase N-terminal domain-containing protein [Sphingomonas sp. ASV193]|uniref:glutathione S-transferase family protein n=1 Tax=Sphingomonas sp. ASV193 TaxID=3144405 RepID=UPI0032E8CA3A
MKLFSIPGTCALSVHVVLEWIGRPYEVEVMERGANRSDAYLAVNPSGQVPALLLDDGRVLTEAAAILPYLAATAPEAGLGGSTDPFGRYELANLLSYLTGEVHVAFKPFFQPQRFLTDETRHQALGEQAFVTLRPMLERLEGMIQGRRFMAGKRSVADPYLYVLLRWVDNAPYGMAPFPSLARYRQAMEEDAGVKHALHVQGMSLVGAGA